jgi:hypothetical protein
MVIWIDSDYILGIDDHFIIGVLVQIDKETWLQYKYLSCSVIVSFKHNFHIFWAQNSFWFLSVLLHSVFLLLFMSLLIPFLCFIRNEEELAGAFILFTLFSIRTSLPEQTR